MSEESNRKEKEGANKRTAEEKKSSEKERAKKRTAEVMERAKEVRSFESEEGVATASSLQICTMSVLIRKMENKRRVLSNAAKQKLK